MRHLRHGLLEIDHLRPDRAEADSDGAFFSDSTMLDTRRINTIIRFALAIVGLGSVLAPSTGCADERADAAAAMRKATAYYRNKVATRGGYVYYYSPDLRVRWGEGLAAVDQIWVQPPGTPTVGMAYLKAYEATGDVFYLDAATEAAEALRYGQLKSGGWQNAVSFDQRGTNDAYRNGKGGGRRNNSTLDDGITQAALQLMMRVDQAHRFGNQKIHESARVALDALLAAQFPNGAFPQVWSGPVDQTLPVLKADYPDHDWRTEGRIKNYWDMYTLNDGLSGTVADTLIDAYRIYEDERCLAALKRLGDFLLLAQMPEPQPAWAQQYNYDMHPIWARRFEPPAITGGESQDALEALLRIAHATGDTRYLEPVPRALAYLRRSLLESGELARYYELRTNRPLYMTRRGDVYLLTYDDSDLPGHYGWKVASRLDRIERDYEALQRGDFVPAEQPIPEALKRAAGRIVAQLDAQGRWLSTYAGERLAGQPKFQPGERYLSSAVFSQNLETLSAFLLAEPQGRRATRVPENRRDRHNVIDTRVRQR